MTYMQQVGRRGEDMAVDFLRRRDYTILARNVHSRYGEIDIVAAKNGTTHYVEVKTRTGYNFGMPEEAVNRKKLTRIKKTVQCTREKAIGSPHEVARGSITRYQIDLIAIELDRNGNATRLTFYKNLNSI